MAVRGVAGEHEFYAAILLAALGSVVGGDGFAFAEAAGFDCGGLNPLLHEIIPHGLRAMLGKLLVVVVGADAVGVAFDGKMQAGIGEDDAGNFCQALARTGREFVAAT